MNEGKSPCATGQSNGAADARPKMGCNLGSTTLRRRREGNAMGAYDALPHSLRLWLANAARPWSPSSCRRIWRKSRARGEDLDTLLARLDRAECQTLERDRISGQSADMKAPATRPEAPGSRARHQPHNSGAQVSNVNPVSSKGHANENNNPEFARRDMRNTSGGR